MVLPSFDGSGVVGFLRCWGSGILRLTKARRCVSMSGKERFWTPGFLLCALVVLLLSGKPLCAQSSSAFTATLSGSVLDPSGSAVNGAKVTLTSPERFSRTASTKDTGLYTFTFLPPVSTRWKWRPPVSSTTSKKESLWPPARRRTTGQPRCRGAERKHPGHFASAASERGQCQYFGRPIREVRRRPPFELSKRHQSDADQFLG